MDGEYNWAALAVPIFLGATIAEVWIARRRRKDFYAFGTALSDLACGSVFQAGELVIKLAFVAAYAWLFEHARFITWDESSPWPWVIGIVGVDLLFYWWHRVSHVVNILWAVHGVHHQSEDYNLAVALRQPLFEPVTWFFFYAPLALLGVSPVVYLAAYGINRFYQFWIHTRVVDKGPAWVEWLLNTPSHHRVHHGVNPQYLDKNYGAVLIVWDRLFGTFEPEVEEPVYGTTVPLRSYSPLWANFVHIQRIIRLGRLAKTSRERLWAWVAHPAWLPEGATDPDAKVDRATYEKYRPAVEPKLQAYLLGHFLFAGTAMSVVVFYEHGLSTPQLAGAATVLIASFAAILGIVEGKPWAWPLERARVVGLSAVAVWLLSGPGGWTLTAALAVGGAMATVSGAALLVLKPFARAR
jgi:sterol desaturase/sphingolipid hydroxylase (fatty acid hydroxylase superfamily)